MNGVWRAVRAGLGPAILVAMSLALSVGIAAAAPRASRSVSAVTVTTLAGTAGVTGSADGTGAAAAFNGPYGVACDVAGNVYVADTGNNLVRKVTQAGVVSTLAGLTAGFNDPQGVACDTAGNVYVADTYDHTIRKITAAGEVTTLAGLKGEQGSDDGVGAAARFCYPCGVACDSAGNVYVADTGNDLVRKITPAGEVSTLVGASAGLSGPQGVACDAAGNVYVADTGDHAVLKVTPTGVVSTLAGPGAGFRYPGGVACDAAGNVYVADTDNNAIAQINPAGQVSTLAGAAGDPGSADGPGSLARFSGPQGVACDASGNVYIADTDNCTVRRLAIDNLAPVTTATPALSPTATSGWRTSPVTVTLSATDTGSGVARTTYSIDGGELITYTTPFIIGDSGSHAVVYSSVDNAGNAEAPQTGYVNIDQAPPVTTATPALASSATIGWRAGSLTVTLSASDALSGVAQTKYSVDGGPSTAYAAPFIVGGTGSHVVTYFSTDNAGNVEAPQTGYVNIDETPPVTRATPALSTSATSGWRNTSLTVTLSASDALSGVAHTFYALDGGEQVDYGAPFTVSEPGSHAVVYSSMDNAGNAESPRTGYVNIDTSAPETSATAAVVRSGGTVALKYRVNDAPPSCGSASVQIQIRTGSKVVKTVAVGIQATNTPLSYRFTATLARGVYSWRVLATDVAGNKAAKNVSAKLSVT